MNKHDELQFLGVGRDLRIYCPDPLIRLTNDSQLNNASEARIFHDLDPGGKSYALELLHLNDYIPVFMPQIIEIRINSSGDSSIWGNGIHALSLIARGHINGELMYVISHTDNYFSDYNNIRKAQKRLINQAGPIPKKIFENLIETDGLRDEQNNRLVWVLREKDFQKFRDSKFGRKYNPLKAFKVDNALEHPITIPFIGGEQRAQQYLQKHKEIYGDKIKIYHYDDWESNDKQPLGRLLLLGLGEFNGFLSAYDPLDFGGRFLGIKKSNS